MIFRLAALCLILSAPGCVKVRPSPYQIALARYYHGLLDGASETTVNAVILDLTEDLKKNPADSGLLLLRTSARLESIRLGFQKDQAFHGDRAQAFFEDLRLLQTLLEKPGDRPAWLAPRVQTMFGDAVLLQTQALPGQTQAAAVRQTILQMQLFRLATEAYVRAGAMAAASAKTAGVPQDQLLALMKEGDKARDGYVNALTGLAQTELFLRLTEAGKGHLVDALATTSGGSFPPASAVSTGTGELDSQVHTLLSQQLAALETLTPETPADYPARIEFALSALREEAAARLLSNPIQIVSATTLPACTRISLYLAGLALAPSVISFDGTGNLATENLAVTLKADPLYSEAAILARVPFLTLQAGTDSFTVRLKDKSFLIPKEGMRLTIQTRSGTNVVTPQAASYFLGQGTAILTKGKPISLTGPGVKPGDNKVAEHAVP